MGVMPEGIRDFEEASCFESSLCAMRPRCQALWQPSFSQGSSCPSELKPATSLGGKALPSMLPWSRQGITPTWAELGRAKGTRLG